MTERTFAGQARLGRREFLRGLGAAGAGLGALGASGGAALGAGRGLGPVKVAAVVTEFTFRSHAHVLLENFLGPYLFDGKRVDPGTEVVALYVDQFPAKDIGRGIAKERNIPIYPTIAGALTRGGGALAVDAVLLIGEHGDYPLNAKGQREYPRKRFFDETAAVFRASGRAVPVFNDKHLSYRWDWAKAMYDEAVRLKAPFMAGSSVPLATRRPAVGVPAGTELVAAVAVHGGNLEGYDFHGLELLLSVIEARKGGETGVASVQFLDGDALWETAEAGLWSVALADAAMAAELGPGRPTLRELVTQAPFDAQPLHGLMLTHKDGFRSVVLRVGQSATRWNFAVLPAGAPAPLASALYVGPWENRNLFKALAHAIQAHFRERQAPYPVERTLLATGALEALMDSRVAGNRLLPTPHLEFGYPTVDFSAFRETGATWELLKPDTPEPKGLDTSGQTLGS